MKNNIPATIHIYRIQYRFTLIAVDVHVNVNVNMNKHTYMQTLEWISMESKRMNDFNSEIHFLIHS